MSQTEPAQPNLLEQLLQIRDQQRAERKNGKWLVSGDDLDWEINQQGKMRWYMHPSIHDTAIRTLIVFVQEIPPGSRSGRQKTPGGQIMFILQGRGYTTVDGVRHYWQERDCVNIPTRRDGVIVQHFNESQEEAVRFICVEPNLVDTLGVDRGSAFEQLEVAPEYEE
ncbi:MAG: cupin domain-containing protein [Chloroflexi bacterium]|nr:cupin domain-containing protein [Chloroflexota bacterium]